MMNPNYPNIIMILNPANIEQVLSDFYLERVGNPEEQIWLYKGGNTVGGDFSHHRNHIRLDTPHCSEYHCFITVDNEARIVTIEDILDTVDGIFVDSERVPPRVPCELYENCVIGLVGGFRDIQQLRGRPDCYAYYLRRERDADSDYYDALNDSKISR